MEDCVPAATYLRLEWNRVHFLFGEDCQDHPSFVFLSPWTGSDLMLRACSSTPPDFPEPPVFAHDTTLLKFFGLCAVLRFLMDEWPPFIRFMLPALCEHGRPHHHDQLRLSCFAWRPLLALFIRSLPASRGLPFWRVFLPHPRASVIWSQLRGLPWFHEDLPFGQPVHPVHKSTLRQVALISLRPVREQLHSSSITTTWIARAVLFFFLPPSYAAWHWPAFP